MSLETLLMHRLFATRTLLVVFTVGAFTNEVGGEITDLNSLSTLTADTNHRTSVEVMHIFVVLLHETFIHSLAKLTDFFFIDNVFVYFCTFLGNLYEFVTSIKVLLLLLLRLATSLSRFINGLAFYWLLIKMLRFFLLNWRWGLVNWSPLLFYGSLDLILLRLIVRVSILDDNGPVVIIRLFTIHILVNILRRGFLLALLPGFFLHRGRLIFYWIVPIIGHRRYRDWWLLLNLSTLRLPICRFGLSLPLRWWWLLTALPKPLDLFIDELRIVIVLSLYCLLLTLFKGSDLRGNCFYPINLILNVLSQVILLLLHSPLLFCF
jgi:hypothetical protein